MHNFVLAFFDAFTRMFDRGDYNNREQQKLERFLGQAENRYHLEQLEREYFSKNGGAWR
jgi:hypothetical protein